MRNYFDEAPSLSFPHLSLFPSLFVVIFLQVFSLLLLPPLRSLYIPSFHFLIRVSYISPCSLLDTLFPPPSTTSLPVPHSAYCLCGNP